MSEKMEYVVLENGWRMLKHPRIEVRPHHYVPNPEVWASPEAYAFLHEMIDDRVRLLAVLKEARFYFKHNPDPEAAAVIESIANCDNIKA